MNLSYFPQQYRDILNKEVNFAYILAQDLVWVLFNYLPIYAKYITLPNICVLKLVFITHFCSLIGISLVADWRGVESPEDLGKTFWHFDDTSVYYRMR